MTEAKIKTVPLKMLYDSWTTDGERIRAGTVLNLPLHTAKQLIAKGKAERADPLPGEWSW
ncbi:hypothetical protein J2Z31_003639 [Sinorhizobium kostiense]|uniref:Uncharacterized protein n=1 Tax=Sinorhizobium kostiense TaxID=76747 RepID=A0ABS4R2L9_9HYPH|nr:hypothetical protein [Sinorhizobium kostiense]MBP2237125.1 hypothetical protein [Sinorhizobium kostiense]